MSRLTYLQQSLAIFMAWTASCATAHAQLEQLAKRVPASANALVVVNVKSAYSSPLAKAQSWSGSGAESHQSGMIALPVEAEVFLMAAELDFEFMQPLWETAIAYLPQPPTIEEIAARSGGQLDKVAGAPAVQRRNDSVVVRIGPKVLGAMAPANRQQVSRWIRTGRQRKSPELSPYLTDALSQAEKPDNHIVLALDFQGLLSPIEVARKLAKHGSLLGEEANVAALSEVLASLRGVRLEVQLRNPVRGRLAVDFGQDIAILGNLAKPLLLSVLAKQGLEIDDLKSWNDRISGNSMILEGQLSESGLRRVLTVLSVLPQLDIE